MAKPADTKPDAAMNKTGPNRPSNDGKSTMWDALGQSVDINLDNLAPFSKGTKNNNSNIPMNLLMSPQQSNKAAPAANHFNFSSPPMSPNRTAPAATPGGGLMSPAGNKPQASSNAAANTPNLLDF